MVLNLSEPHTSAELHYSYHTHQLLNQHDIFAISEHWLQTYDLQSLQTLHPDFFNFLSFAPPAEEDDLYCRPRHL